MKTKIDGLSPRPLYWLMDIIAPTPVWLTPTPQKKQRRDTRRLLNLELIHSTELRILLQTLPVQPLVHCQCRAARLDSALLKRKNSMNPGV